MPTRISLLLAFAALVTACGPNPSTDDGATTTKTTTTVTTSQPADATPAAPADAAPVAPATPMPAPPAPLSTLTQANLDRVQPDMSQAEVEAIFGQPTSSDTQPIPLVGGTQTTYTYQNGNSAVTIVFKNNQMKQKSGTFNP